MIETAVYIIFIVFFLICVVKKPISTIVLMVLAWLVFNLATDRYTITLSDNCEAEPTECISVKLKDTGEAVWPFGEAW